ncbi:MAG: GtrA family protein [Polynucleobacter sp.]|nr:MAG: GtrA family protein [Polynucleobacter sp.]
MNQPMKLELAIFLIVGLLTVLIDFLIYRAPIHFNTFGFNSVDIAKGIGFIGGTIFAYFANRFWTFQQQTTNSGSVTRFILIYILGLSANIAINHLTISWLSDAIIIPEYIPLIAFVLATGVSATLNFIGMKFFVFTDRKGIHS